MMVQDQKEISIKMIGDYLLKGWTLTDFGCADCNTPLMRSRGGETVCTFCCQRPIQKETVLAVQTVKDESITSNSDFQSNIKQKLLNISQDMLLCKDYDQIKLMIDTANSLITLISNSQKL